MQDISLIMSLDKDARFLLLRKLHPFDIHRICIAYPDTPFSAYCKQVVWNRFLQIDYPNAPANVEHPMWQYLAYWLTDLKNRRNDLDTSEIVFFKPDWPRTNDGLQPPIISTYLNPTRQHVFGFSIPNTGEPQYEGVRGDLMSLYIQFLQEERNLTLTSNTLQLPNGITRHSCQVTFIQFDPAYYYRLFALGFAVRDDFTTSRPAEIQYIRSCLTCKTPIAQTRCRMCKVAAYCGQECANAHWKVHKLECKK
jgi:hypothetical protein